MSLTLLSLLGDASSTCGYCGPEPGTRSSSKSSHSYGVYPVSSEISCAIYQAMIDRGWRRSGCYLYKPSMETTCCPQYTIRLDALKFTPSRSQRQVTNRWNRYIREGDQKGDHMELDGARGKGKGKAPAFDLVTAIHHSEASFLTDAPFEPAHRFEVTLEPSSITEEKFELYQVYQHEVHKEKREKTSSGFRRFLVDSPLSYEAIPYPTPPPSHLPKTYGAYHQCYRVDGELIAMAVLDILPQCVSSVYFMYNSRWERFSLGKISALREASLAREIHDAGILTMGYLYMGFYIHSCPKMRYKGDYTPSYLLDPEEYAWYPFRECVDLLDKHRYVCFSHPEKSSHEALRSKEEVLLDIPPEVLARFYVLDSFDMRTGTAHVNSVEQSPRCQVPETRELVVRGIRLLGPEVAQKIILCLDE